MTSAINYQTISTTYPVAGQDNDSQGFRNNFTAIAAGLATAADELTDLQSKVILKQALTGTQLDNNLQGSNIYNGTFSQFYGVAGGIITAAGNRNIDVSAGVIQQFTISGTVILTFTNWPPSGQYGVARIMLQSSGNTSRTVTLQTSNGTFRPVTGWTTSGQGATGITGASTVGVNLDNTGKYEVIEAWTVTGGNTVFIKNTGEY